MDSEEELDQYFKANEPPMHWQLRKMFIKKYKDRLDSDELLCLSQVLLNIEFLGCRYPSETMQRVEALASDILKEFHSKRSGNLKRTLVSAQQATANKYRKTESNSTASKFSIQFVKSKESEPPVITGSDEHKKFYSILKDVVLFKIEENSGEVNYFNSIRKTINSNKIGQWKESQNKFTYSCSYKGEQLLEVTGDNQKKARADYSSKLYKLLRNYCHLLVKKVQYYTGDNQVISKTDNAQKPSSDNTNSDINTFQENKLGTDNIGYRMLKALGWKEGENTKNGIVDPIGLSVKIGRGGLGSENEKKQNLNMQYFRKILQNFRDSGSEFDLVFSPEFSKAERAELHKLAQKIGLTTKSQTVDEQRFLVVKLKRTLSPQEIKQKIQSGEVFYNAIWELYPPELKEYKELEI